MDKGKNQHFNETATIKHIAQGLMHCAYDQFTCPFLELGCLTCLIHTISHPRCHGRSWNGIFARPHPHSDRQCRQQLPGKNGLSGSIGFFFASGGKTARAHTHTWCFQLHNELVVSPPRRKHVFIVGDHMGSSCYVRWVEVKPLINHHYFYPYFVSIIYLVYHSQAFKAKFNQSPGAGPDASIPLPMGCPNDFHGVFVGDLAAEILKILKV